MSIGQRIKVKQIYELASDHVRTLFRYAATIFSCRVCVLLDYPCPDPSLSPPKRNDPEEVCGHN